MIKRKSMFVEPCDMIRYIDGAVARFELSGQRKDMIVGSRCGLAYMLFPEFDSINLPTPVQTNEGAKVLVHHYSKIGDYLRNAIGHAVSSGFGPVAVYGQEILEAPNFKEAPLRNIAIGTSRVKLVEVADQFLSMIRYKDMLGKKALNRQYRELVESAERLRRMMPQDFGREI